MPIQEKNPEYVTYQGREVLKKHFRVFVYGKNTQKLVESYPEYLEAIQSNEWFDSPPLPKQKQKKVKEHGSDSTRIC